MNNLNTLENRLAGWRPRPPSANLEAKIFGTPSTLEDQPRVGRLALLAMGRWFSDARHTAWVAAACFALLAGWLTGLAPLAPRIQVPTRGVVPVLAALSNQSFTAYLSLERSRRNCWSAPIFGWTNARSIPSSTGSLDHLNTNDLLPRL